MGLLININLKYLKLSLVAELKIKITSFYNRRVILLAIYK